MEKERRLPLFPLNTVLFPNGTMPLHVFEERYRLMVKTCLEGDSKFGIALIKSGSEVGEPAEPHPVGTVARIEDVNRLDDGRMLLVVKGVERFAILRIVQQKPYVEADVRLLAGEPCDGPVDAELLDAARSAAARHVRLVLGLRGGWTREVTTPDDPAELSYFVGGLLQSDPTVKQSLLEEPSTSSRLRRELELLREDEQKLKALVAQRLGRPRSGG